MLLLWYYEKLFKKYTSPFSAMPEYVLATTPIPSQPHEEPNSEQKVEAKEKSEEKGNSTKTEEKSDSSKNSTKLEEKFDSSKG